MSVFFRIGTLRYKLAHVCACVTGLQHVDSTDSGGLVHFRTLVRVAVGVRVKVG